jgi:hypothetical protein
MNGKESPAEKGIVSLRTQLTAALLAVSLLQRKGSSSADSQRLRADALNALAKMRDELARLDKIVAQLEDREAMRADPLRLKTWRGRKPGCGKP